MPPTPADLRFPRRRTKRCNGNEEVNKKEIEYILLFGSNDPRLGYNQRPKFNG